MSLAEYCILNGISLEIQKGDNPLRHYIVQMYNSTLIYTHCISTDEVIYFAGNFSTIETKIIKAWEEGVHKHEKSLSDRVQGLNLSGNSVGMCMGEHGNSCGKEASKEQGTD